MQNEKNMHVSSWADETSVPPVYILSFGNMNHQAQLRKQIQEVRSSLHGASS